MTADTRGRRAAAREPQAKNPHNHGDNTWMADGACRDHPDPELWFTSWQQHSNAEMRRIYHERNQRARAICAACPVTVACHTYAETNHLDGIWAGLDEHQRKQLRKAPK